MDTFHFKYIYPASPRCFSCRLVDRRADPLLNQKVELDEVDFVEFLAMPKERETAQWL